MNVCPFCENEYTPNLSVIKRHGKQIYCSKRCSGLAHTAEHRTRIFISNKELLRKLDKIAANKDYDTKELIEIILNGWISDYYPKHGPDASYVQSCLTSHTPWDKSLPTKAEQ